MRLGRGIPNRLCANKCNTPATDQDFPPANIAAQLYAHEAGSTLTDPATFAPSPFPSVEHQQQCDSAFAQRVPDLMALLHAAVNRDYNPFQMALMLLIDLTRQYST